MILDKNKNILIVGLGLLGGCYGMALRRWGYKVSAITLKKEDIDYALENDIITYGTTEVEEDLVKGADLIVFALYPHIFLEWIEKYGHLIKEGAIITDVTGVKTAIIDKVQSALKPGVEFISAHPMAGREVGGVKNSDDAIFRDANYIVVPTEKNTEEAIELCVELGHILGFRRVSVLSPEKHDNMIAFLSQLTHCIAVSLMCSNDDPDLVKFTGDSFRDLTRIAKINEEMWSELFSLNKQELVRQMECFEDSFKKLKQALISDDTETMKEMMRISTKRRSNFDKQKKG